jgi:hypothetical protein
MGFSDMSDFETGSALTMSDDEDPTYPTLCLSMSPDPTRSTRVGGDLDDLDAVTILTWSGGLCKRAHL